MMHGNSNIKLKINITVCKAKGIFCRHFASAVTPIQAEVEYEARTLKTLNSRMQWT